MTGGIGSGGGLSNTVQKIDLTTGQVVSLLPLIKAR